MLERAAEISPTTVRTRWLRRYQGALVAVDAAAAVLATVAAFLLRFGDSNADTSTNVLFGALLPFAWLACIAVNHAYEGRFVGVGPAEFERVFRAFLHLTALTVFVSFVSKADIARSYVLGTLLFALAFDLAGRMIARKVLHRSRARGRNMTNVLAVGSSKSVAEFTALLRRDRYAGMRVVAACTAETITEADTMMLGEFDIPLLGSVDDVRTVARLAGAHTVAVLSGSVAAERLRWIAWQLEGTDTDLVVSPGLTEVGGRRLHIQPVAGLPLLHVDEPEFSGFRRVVKGAFDRAAAGMALLVFSPVLLGLALAVKLDSKGPALFKQTRIGRNGREFKMIKFRSMVVDAEAQLARLNENNESDGLLFKMKRDPRITRLGAFLRRFSLDELPQLINVLNGTMSLVGPRPPLPSEVSRYGDDVRRRLLVKPGLTGLWQVSGRSDLSWEESVRLDLRYVENWSLSMDMLVLWKTGRAVFKADGAY